MLATVLKGERAREVTSDIVMPDLQTNETESTLEMQLLEQRAESQAAA